jgi:hypothetical protein
MQTQLGALLLWRRYHLLLYTYPRYTCIYFSYFCYLIYHFLSCLKENEKTYFVVRPSKVLMFYPFSLVNHRSSFDRPTAATPSNGTEETPLHFFNYSYLVRSLGFAPLEPETFQIPEYTRRSPSKPPVLVPQPYYLLIPSGMISAISRRDLR